VGTDIWIPRNLYASLPALALLVGACLAALPGRLSLAAATIVVAVLVLGTMRSFESAYNRGPYRQIAAYLDRTARPNDPVTIISFAGTPAIPIQFRRPHQMLQRPDQWPATAGTAHDYLIVDETVTQRYLTGVPSGFALVGRRRWIGTVPVDLFVYRARGP